jgi:hypothetical protein
MMLFLITKEYLIMAPSEFQKIKYKYVSSTQIGVALSAVELGGAGISSQIVVNKRGRPPLPASKQLAAYLVHVSLSIQFHTLSSHLKCDRATIEAACGRVEDLRDNSELDLLINLYETTLCAWAQAFDITAT